MAKKSNPTAKPTLVTFLLDRSGSMGSCLDTTIEAFNGYVDGMRDTPSIDFSLVLFDAPTGIGMHLDKICVATPINQAPKLSKANYNPRGSTPLIDAAYTVIKAVEKSLAEKPKDTQVVICIQTDGQENCSREHTWESLNALIQEKQKLGWQFNFMGAGIDAYQQGAKMGLSVANTMSYDHTDIRATRAAFAGRASATVAYASGLSGGMNISEIEKKNAGDKYDPGKMTGFWNTLTPDQQKKARAYRGPENHGAALDLTKPVDPKAPQKEDFTL